MLEYAIGKRKVNMDSPHSRDPQKPALDELKHSLPANNSLNYYYIDNYGTKQPVELYNSSFYPAKRKIDGAWITLHINQIKIE